MAAATDATNADSSPTSRHRISRRVLAALGAVLAAAVVAAVLVLSGVFGGEEWMSGFAGTWAAGADGEKAEVVIGVDRQSDERGSIEMRWLVDAEVNSFFTLSIDGDTLRFDNHAQIRGAALERQGSPSDGLYGTWTGSWPGENPITVAITKTSDRGTTLSISQKPAEYNSEAFWVNGDTLVIDINNGAEDHKRLAFERK
jgi:hypothetical protein